MAGFFNSFRIVNGELEQFDEIINGMAHSSPAAKPETHSDPTPVGPTPEEPDDPQPEYPDDPYNPLGLPPYTIRCKFAAGYTPDMGDSQTLHDEAENIWDITKNAADWTRLFKENTQLLEVIGANTTNVTVLAGTFTNCTSLTSICLFDTQNVTSFYSTFNENTALRSVIPAYDLGSAENVSYMFFECFNIQGGIVDFYQRAWKNTKLRSPIAHNATLKQCGKNTSAAAELEQIPDTWKSVRLG